MKVPWIPSPLAAIYRALELAGASSCDVLYDLGAGDGRVVVIAARDFGVSLAVGIEVNPLLAEAARVKAKMDGVADRVRIIEGDFFKTSIAGATIVYMYLYRSVNEALRPKLEQELEPGARVVTLDFPVPGWTPVVVRRIRDEADIPRTIHLYVVGISDRRWSRRGLTARATRALKALAGLC
jgi:SAM-dependent methyltransferase